MVTYSFHIMLYKVGQCINSLKVTIYIKVTERYVFVVLFISNIIEPGGSNIDCIINKLY